jgi:predicted PurR-regulated permease PerM
MHDDSLFPDGWRRRTNPFRVMPANRTSIRPRLPLAPFVGYVAAALAMAGLFFVGWRLRQILLLTFGAIVFAAIIRAIARPLIARFPRREKLAVAGAVLALFLVVGGLFWLFGQQIAAQMRGLGERLPEAVATAKTWLQQHAPGRFVLEKLASSPEGGSGMESVKHAAAITLDSVGHALLMLVAAIYFALTPRTYLDGTVRLLPPAQREKVRDALVASGHSLQNWLLGQLVSMGTIGLLTMIGLAIVGCPVPVALGILAGLLTFVPVVGFIVSFVPTVLIAFSESPQVALAATIVFLVVQQLEEQVVLPLAQKWATALPPALGLLALAAAGTLFGLPGLVFGCPLTVVVVCLVKKLYLENGIEKHAA